MVIADANGKGLASFLTRLHDRLGNSWKYIGAGAGSQKEERLPCVFTSEAGLHRDAVTLGFIDGSSSIVARHGWQRSAGPVLVTRVEGDVIQELNWLPALEVYRSLIREVAGLELDRGNLDEIGLSFPFGMLKEGSEDLIRVPLGVTSSGGLESIGGVHENSVLYILGGTEEDFLNAAREGAQSCAASLGRPVKHSILLDCVTRSSDLGDRFHSELAAVSEGVGGTEVLGALSRGEFASTGMGYPAWLNKTMVVGAFG